MEVYVTRSSLPKLEEYIEEIKPIFESHRLTNMGPVYQKFHQQLIEYLKVPYLSLFSNGHLALEIALQALNLEKGGEIITSPFTFISTTHAIVRQGFKPVFADIRHSDYTIDPVKIEELITDKTVAILPVHVYGHICDVDKIEEIANRNNVKILYDAAHAFGETFKGMPIGCFGDMTMFSFHATKVFNTVEGGAVTFHDAQYMRALSVLMNFGIENEERVTDIAGNAKLDELRAAMGICNLRHHDACVAARKKVYDLYHEQLKDVAGIRTSIIPDNVESNYTYYPIEIDPEVYGSTRDEVFISLAEAGIHSRKYFYPIVTETEAYRQRFSSENVPIAKKVGERILTVPLYPDLDVDVIMKVCEIIKSLEK